LQGALDNKLLQPGAFLRELRSLVHATNAATAAKLGINPSAAMTVIKPSGNSGERFGTGNAITGWFAPYFIRRVYVQAAEPMCAFLMDQGVPHEDHYYDPSVKVFLFPKKAPEGAVIRGTQTALEQLDWWLKLKVHWTDHNPSATIYVKDHEWDDVERWILRNRSSIGGLAFLPYSDHVYAQAPFTECTEIEHSAALARFPDVDWSRLAEYDRGVDTTTGGQEFACTGDKCTI
jgi:ribonucleoside-diphosphate reductase alpha chain